MGWTAGLPDFWLNEDGTCRRSSSEITQRNGSVRYGTECSEIVYSVRIGPPQPISSSPLQSEGLELIGVLSISVASL
jgi:hypothetical protein